MAVLPSSSMIVKEAESMSHSQDEGEVWPVWFAALASHLGQTGCTKNSRA